MPLRHPILFMYDTFKILASQFWMTLGGWKERRIIKCKCYRTPLINSGIFNWTLKWISEMSGFFSCFFTHLVQWDFCIIMSMKYLASNASISESVDRCKHGISLKSQHVSQGELPFAIEEYLLATVGIPMRLNATSSFQTKQHGFIIVTLHLICTLIFAEL